MLRPTLRAALLVALLALPAQALATTGIVEVRGPGGQLLARADGGAFSYPANGALLHVADSSTTASRVELRGVSLLRGAIRIARILVPAHGLRGARVTGLRIAGRAYPAAANTLVPLGGPSYLVALQEAVAPGLSGSRVGVVGLRVHLGAAVAGLPAGSELWIGLAAAARPPSPKVRVDGIPTSLVPLYRRAARRYHLPWTVLAAINRYETSFGANLGPSRAGAIGWMQFLPSTWKRWGADGNGDGRRNPNDPADAILAAARYLAAAGGRVDLARAVFAYNHSASYVAAVLGQAASYAGVAPSLRPGGPLDPSLLGR